MGRSLAAPAPKKKPNASSVTSASRARVAGNPVPNRGNFSEEDDGLIIKLHSLLGDEWSKIAELLPGRTDIEIKNNWNTHLKGKLDSRGIDSHTHRPLNAPTATDPVAVVNSNNNDGSNNNNNNNGEFQQQYISRTQASSLNTASVRQQNSDASNNSISSTSGFSQREIYDPPIGDGGSASVHVASNRVTEDEDDDHDGDRDLSAAKKDDEHIIALHNLLGNNWSKIAEFLPGRTDIEIEDYWNTHLKGKLDSRGIDSHTHRPLNAPTATDPIAVINSNNNDGSNNNNSEFQQYISRTQASSLNTGSVHQQNSDASNNSISSTSGFSQREIYDPPNADVGSASVHVASNRVTRDLNAVEKEDAASAHSISESTNFSIWEKGESIESGGFGIVYVARNRETGALCAVKELKDSHKLGSTESLQKEIKILSQLEHTNVVKYYGYDIVGCHISLYMEYVQPGSLKNYISKQRGLPEPLIRNFTRQILSGLAYLHSKRVVHRDLKPNNLLVDSNNIVKLVDFGLSKHLQESVGRHSELGTSYYSAPEVVKKIEYQSSCEAYAADIWSLGCVIIEMFSGNHPWPGFEPQQVIYKVGKKQHPPIPEKLCQEGNNFLKLCFTRSPADRPSASALLDHSFVKPQTTSLADGRKYN